MTDFIAVDVETANADLASICSIGLIHFRNGFVHNNISTLVNPEDRFEPMNIAVHGIRPDDVVNAPTMRELYPVFLEKFRDVILAHHTHFDRTAFRKVGDKLGLPELSCKWIDTARVTRHAWPQYAMSGYGLANVCCDFEISFRHHDAAEDARAAGLILCKAIEDTQTSLSEWLARVETPIRSSQVEISVNPEGPLFGHIIVFTGTLTVPRATAETMAAGAGCRVSKGVTKETTLVVVGEQDIRALAGHTKSSKHRKAEALAARGQDLRILGEKDFLLMILNGRGH